jgi:hypothetical protein
LGVGDWGLDRSAAAFKRHNSYTLQLLDVSLEVCYTSYSGVVQLLCERAMENPTMSSQHTVEIPQSVLVSAHSLDDLEDWLSANDPAFLEEVRRIRNEEDLAGGGKDFTEVLKRWPIES